MTLYSLVKDMFMTFAILLMKLECTYNDIHMAGDFFSLKTSTYFVIWKSSLSILKVAEPQQIFSRHIFYSKNLIFLSLDLS